MSNPLIRRSRRPGPALSKVAACLLLPLLAACATERERRSDQIVDQILAEQAARDSAAETAAAPVDADAGGYPDLHAVPERPKLSYSIAQRDQIQDGLVADLANARHSAELVRTTEGADPPAVAPVPSLAAAPVAATAATAPLAATPQKPQLTEQRDRNGELTNLLDQVVGDQESSIDPATVPALPGEAEGAAVEPAAPPTLSTMFSSWFGSGAAGSATENAAGAVEAASAPVEVAAADAVAPAAEVAPAAGAADGPLAIGRLWRLDLTPDEAGPSAQALDPVVAALSVPEALSGRRLSILGQGQSPELAAGRALLARDALVQAGVPADRLEVENDRSIHGDAVVIMVLAALP